eukprot:SM000202S05881  [mRNA]  locus=s202:113399:115418:+ [translate_table: standard]
MAAGAALPPSSPEAVAPTEGGDGGTGGGKDGGEVMFILEKASLEAAKVGKVRRATPGGAGFRDSPRCRELFLGMRRQRAQELRLLQSELLSCFPSSWSRQPLSSHAEGTDAAVVTYQLLNCDDHANFLRKHKRDPALYRPDIVHQTLLSILDSPLNKAGYLKGLYVLTDRNVLIQVNPHIRIPRTFKRFCGLMVQLLQKLSIRATNGPDKLLRVVKQPVTKYLPVGCRRIGLSVSAPKVVTLRDYVAICGNAPLVFVVGAMAHGKIEADYTDDFVAVSEYPLSAACCVGRICNALELKYGIL